MPDVNQGGASEREYDRSSHASGQADLAQGYDRSSHAGRQGAAGHHYDRWSHASGQDVAGSEYDRSSQLGRSVAQSAGPRPVEGPYIGRGPRGYQRSDDRIREDLCERLTEHGQLDASDIEVKVENAEVTLAGTVDSPQAKQMAEDTAESVPGVQQVHSQLRVAIP